MALRHIDGFDHYATADALQKWDVSGGTIISGAARTGPSGYRQAAPNQTLTKILDAQATWIIGFAYRTGSIAANVAVVTFLDGATSHVDLRIDGSGHCYFTRNGTTIGSVGTFALLPSVMYYLEVKVTISDTVGVAVLKINGATELNGSSLDTRNGGNASADRVAFGGSSSGVVNIDLDDIYICDATGGSPTNDFLGDCKVETLVPTGAGNSTQFTPSTGSNWQNVDEATPNGDTDYNSDGTATDKDTYQMGNLATASGTVYGVQSVVVARKDDAGSRTIHAVVRSGSSESNGSDRSVSATYVQYRDIFEAKPGGGAWAIADVNGMEAGVAVVS